MAVKRLDPVSNDAGANKTPIVLTRDNDRVVCFAKKLLRKRLSSIFAVLYALSMLAATTAAVIAYSQGKEPDINMQGVYFIFAFVFALASGISAIVEIFTAKLVSGCVQSVTYSVYSDLAYSYLQP